MDPYLEKALDLLLRLPPQLISRFIENVIKLRPHIKEDLLMAIDQPLQLKFDNIAKRKFLMCDCNRDGESHRSPWTNIYFPCFVEGVRPSRDLRKLEIEANMAFAKYLDMYYEGGLSSVYMWNLDEKDFAVCVLLKKVGENARFAKGSWDAIHIIQVTDTTKGFSYRITSTIMLWLHTKKQGSGVMNISGSINRQNQKSFEKSKQHCHVVAIGEIVEEMENHMRNTLYEVYFWKTKDVVTRQLRSPLTRQAEAEIRRKSQMLSFRRPGIQRSPSGKHLLVPMQHSFKV